MRRTVKDPAEIKDLLVQDLKTGLGDNLLSVVIFGSAASARYKPGSSDINVLLVLKDDSVQKLTGLRDLEKRWERSSVVFSFFFTPENILSSLDSYPLEFTEIKHEHLVLFGADYFSGLEINTSLLRLQCERDLKGKLLHLKREFVRCHHDKCALRDLLNISLKHFQVIFRGIARYMGLTDLPTDSGALCDTVVRKLGLDSSVFKLLATAGFPKDLAGLNDLAVNYINAISSLSKAVDLMELEKK